MPSLHQSVERRFSAAAGTYDDHAEAQRESAKRLLADLPPYLAPWRILEIGCGTGQLTTRLRTRFPNTPIDAIDRSGTMVQEAQAHCGEDESIHWMTGDFMAEPIPRQYPLLISNATLHWVEPIVDGFRRLRQLASMKARLACAIMIDGTLGELHEARLRAAPSKPPRSRLPSEGEVVRSLQAVGFRAERFHVETSITRHASADAFLQAIHDMGLTGGSVSRAAVPLNRTELERLRTDYQYRFPAAGGGVRATYRFLLVQARAI